MNKLEFTEMLSSHLSVLSEEERNKSLDYYTEIIGDRMEDGMSEEDAVEALGDMDEIVNNIMMDIPLSQLIKVKVSDKKSRMNNNALWVTLTVLGFPLWFPIVATVISLIIVLYVVIWSLIITLYATVISIALAGIAGLVGGVAACFTNGIFTGLLLIGAALVLLGLAVLLFKPMVFLTKQLVRLTVWLFRKIKSLFIVRKEAKEI